MRYLGLFFCFFFLACSPYNALDKDKEYGFKLEELQGKVLKNPPASQSRIYLYRKDSAQSFRIEYQQEFKIRLSYKNTEKTLRSKPYEASFLDIKVDDNSTLKLKAKIDNDFSLDFIPKKDMIYCLQSEILQDNSDSSDFVSLPVFTLVSKDECVDMIEKKMKKNNECKLI